MTGWSTGNFLPLVLRFEWQKHDRIQILARPTILHEKRNPTNVTTGGRGRGRKLKKFSNVLYEWSLRQLKF